MFDNAEVSGRGVRVDQARWKRTLPQLLKASDKDIIRILTEDGLLCNWKGKTCPSCNKGTLSSLTAQPGRDAWK